MSNLTESAIKKATLKIAQTRPLNKVTVKDISKACGINRSTFYYHFDDIFDVIAHIIDEQLEELTAQYGSDFEKIVIELVEYSARYKTFWKNLYDSCGRDWLEKFVMARLHYLVIRALRKEAGDMQLPIRDVEIICCFYAEAVCGMLVRWINNDRYLKTAEDLKYTLGRAAQLFNGQMELIVDNIRNSD